MDDHGMHRGEGVRVHPAERDEPADHDALGRRAGRRGHARPLTGPVARAPSGLSARLQVLFLASAPARRWTEDERCSSGREPRAPAAPVEGSPGALAAPGGQLLLLRAFLGVTFTFAGLQKLANPNFLRSGPPGSFDQQLLGAMVTSPLSTGSSSCRATPRPSSPW